MNIILVKSVDMNNASQIFWWHWFISWRNLASPSLISHTCYISHPSPIGIITLVIKGQKKYIIELCRALVVTTHLIISKKIHYNYACIAVDEASRVLLLHLLWWLTIILIYTTIIWVNVTLLWPTPCLSSWYWMFKTRNTKTLFLHEHWLL